MATGEAMATGKVVATGEMIITGEVVATGEAEVQNVLINTMLGGGIIASLWLLAI